MGEGPGNVGLRPGRGGAGHGGSLGVPVGAHSSRRGAMEAPAELLAALPALATALALLLAWLLLRRAQAGSSDPAGASPEPAPRAEAGGTSALCSPGAPEPAAAPEEPGEPAGPAEAEKQAAEAKQVRTWPARNPSSPRPGSFPGSHHFCRPSPSREPDPHPRAGQPQGGRSPCWVGREGRRANSRSCPRKVPPRHERACPSCSVVLLAFLLAASPSRSRAPHLPGTSRLCRSFAPGRTPHPPAHGFPIHVQVADFEARTELSGL